MGLKDRNVEIKFISQCKSPIQLAIKRKDKQKEEEKKAVQRNLIEMVGLSISFVVKSLSIRVTIFVVIIGIFFIGMKI